MRAMSLLDFMTVFASGMFIGMAGGLGADTPKLRVIRFIVGALIVLPFWAVQAYLRFKKKTPPSPPTYYRHPVVFREPGHENETMLHYINRGGIGRAGPVSRK